jgi:hypothetical protein
VASSQDLLASDEWDDLFAKQLDVALRTTAIPQQALSSTAADLFEEISAHDVEEAVRRAVDHTSARGDGNYISAMGAMQYERPQGVQPWRAGAGVRVRGQNTSLNNLDISAISQQTASQTPTGAVDHQQQRSDRVRPGTRPVWMGRGYEPDGFGRVATVGPVPAFGIHWPLEQFSCLLDCLHLCQSTVGTTPSRKI